MAIIRKDFTIYVKDLIRMLKRMDILKLFPDIDNPGNYLSYILEY